MASPMPDDRAAIGEQPPTQVLEQGGALPIEVGDHQVGPAVAVEVTASHSHAGLVSPRGVPCHAGQMSNFVKVEAPFVAVQVIGRAVVRYEEVDAIIIIQIGGHDPEASSAGFGESGLRSDVHKATTVIAEDMIRGGLDLERFAVDRFTLAVPAEKGIRRIPEHVMANIEIQIAVVVQIGEHR